MPVPFLPRPLGRQTPRHFLSLSAPTWGLVPVELNACVCFCEAPKCVSDFLSLKCDTPKLLGDFQLDVYI